MPVALKCDPFTLAVSSVERRVCVSFDILCLSFSSLNRVLLVLARLLGARPA